jgi:hypothetical protein
MKKIIPFAFLILLFLSFSFLPPDRSGKDRLDNLVVEFIATNYWGNNLYIDNLSIGTQFDFDVDAVSINNIEKDTTYSIYGNNAFTIVPNVAFLNAGKQNITSAFIITMQISPGSYTSTKQIFSMRVGQDTTIAFAPWTVTPGTAYHITTFCALSNDQNRQNDTISQYSLYQPGTRRNVLYEEFTSTSCGGCAGVNPFLDSIIALHFDSSVAIKYHVWWPDNNDPMYLYNPEQIAVRKGYYLITAIPELEIDGVYRRMGPEEIRAQMLDRYYDRLAKATPVGLSVTDTRIPGDSIRADVTLNILSPLPPANYRMRLNVIERHIHYNTPPPGGNGEMDFYDVFRRYFPDSSIGAPIPIQPGTYNYTFKYKLDTVWNDSMIYSAVYVQKDDSSKEVLNCAKARHFLDNDKQIIRTAENLSKQIVNAVHLESSEVTLEKDQIEEGIFDLEPFEGNFPPDGWTLINPDRDASFHQFSSANGPSFGGSKSMQMPFYTYNNIGQTDTLRSKMYTGIDTGDCIKFDWAYGYYTGCGDRLQVLLSTDGGTTFPYTIFDRAGERLKTAAYNGNFVPSGPQDWQTHSFCIRDLIGIQPLSNNIPKIYNLYANYPNPFNPSTSIRFDIPRNSLVKLIVYDITGKCAGYLINSKLTPGTYSVKWDGYNYASGVYFYKLEVRNAGASDITYSNTMKMVLVK